MKRSKFISASEANENARKACEERILHAIAAASEVGSFPTYSALMNHVGGDFELFDRTLRNLSKIGVVALEKVPNEYASGYTWGDITAILKYYGRP